MKVSIYFIVIVFLLISIFVFGCEKSGTEPETEPLELQLIPTHVSIYEGSDGAINLTVTGGTNPYQYQWSNGETTEDITNLSAGMYSVIVTDSDNQSATDSVEITEPDVGIWTVTDYDGNVYKTVKIGNQCWMAENLKTKHTADGSILSGVYAYNDDESYVADYGRLYNWESAKLAAPVGWHLPSDDEWNILLNTLGSNSTSQLIEGGSSGFNAKLGGLRLSDGTYNYLGVIGAHWTSTAGSEGHALQKLLAVNQSEVTTDNTLFGVGLSVRCIKD